MEKKFRQIDSIYRLLRFHDIFQTYQLAWKTLDAQHWESLLEDRPLTSKGKIDHKGSWGVRLKRGGVVPPQGGSMPLGTLSVGTAADFSGTARSYLLVQLIQCDFYEIPKFHPTDMEIGHLHLAIY